MAHEEVSIRTADGTCKAHVLTPSGAGPWPVVILYMDAGGIRPALVEMGQKLADAGYLVLLPDMFYRAGPYGPLVPTELFASGNLREVIGPLMATTDNRKAAQDTGALLEYLATRKDVAGARIGVTGYCMGGAFALTVAGVYPDRVAAAASFHGGNLANDTELSPHLQASATRARVYIGVAENDGSYPPEMAAKLEQALSAAGVSYTSELYHAAHGWTQTDFPVYDEAEASRHWRELFKLLRETLH